MRSAKTFENAKALNGNIVASEGIVYRGLWIDGFMPSDNLYFIYEDTENGVVEKKGAWLQFNGELIGQGKEAAQKALVEKPEIAKKIVEAIMAKRNGVTAIAT